VLANVPAAQVFLLGFLSDSPCGSQATRSQVSPVNTTILVQFFCRRQFSISARFLVPLVISRAGQNSVRDSPSALASVGAIFLCH
jgi:hypothetical protein